MARHKKKRRLHHLHKIIRRRYGKFILPLLFLVFFLAVGVYVVPTRLVHGIDYSPTPSVSQSLGEDTLTTCTAPDVVMHGSQDKKEVALTFDADMTYGMDRNLHTGAVKSYINRDLINTLINTQTPATLFLTGLWIKDYPEDTKMLAQNPLFELANHSYSHPSFEGYCYGLPKLGPLTMQDEIDVTQELLKAYTGVDNKYFRFPGGCVSNDALNYLRSKGMQTILWDTVGEDGFNPNAQSIIANVLNRVQNGSIIVLHMNGYPNDPATSQALPTIISTLKNRGYTFVKVSELLGN